MMTFAFIMNITQSLSNLCFSLRWNLLLGIPDLTFLFTTEFIFGVSNSMFFVLPILSLFAKMTPPKVEGTIFAFLTGTWNLSEHVIAPCVGAFINQHFVGIDKDHIQNYPTLRLISFVGCISSCALIPIIPT